MELLGSIQRNLTFQRIIMVNRIIVIFSIFWANLICAQISHSDTIRITDSHLILKLDTFRIGINGKYKENISRFSGAIGEEPLVVKKRKLNEVFHVYRNKGIVLITECRGKRPFKSVAFYFDNSLYAFSDAYFTTGPISPFSYPLAFLNKKVDSSFSFDRLKSSGLQDLNMSKGENAFDSARPNSWMTFEKNGSRILVLGLNWAIIPE